MADYDYPGCYKSVVSSHLMFFLTYRLGFNKISLIMSISVVVVLVEDNPEWIL